MLKNYLKIAWRNLMKNKFFSFINIGGLSIGIAAFLLILQYVSFELSYDNFNKNADNIYRVVNDRYQNGKLIQHGTLTYSAIGKAMQQDFPEVANYTRVVPFSNEIIATNTKKIGGLSSLAVDNSFLSMFSYPLIYGSIKTALEEPRSIILSQALAKNMFGVNDIELQSLLGKEIKWGNDSLQYKITGICKEVPENSHLQFDFLTSYITMYTGTNAWKDADYSFSVADFRQYIQLKDGTDYKALETKFPAFVQRHFQQNKISDEQFYLQPLSKAHLYSDFQDEIGKTSSAIVVWGLLTIAILIIVIASINYINLATAKSTERAKEVGIRKVSGASKHRVVIQFLTESFVVTIIALLIALLIVRFAQNSFNNLIHHQLSLSYLFEKGLSNYKVLAPLGALIIACIFISGFYPAFVLSSFKPIAVLKGKYISTRKGILLRKMLVIGQFAVTVTLIIGSVIVYQQIRYVTHRDLGFNMSQMLIIKSAQLMQSDSTFIGKENAFIANIKESQNVLGAAVSWNLPGDELPRDFNLRADNLGNEIHFTAQTNGVSPDFIPLYQMKMLSGRNFDARDYTMDWDKLHSVIINEKLSSLLGFKTTKDAIGSQLFSGDRHWNVIGVVNDFHQKSLRYPIEPTVLYPSAYVWSAFSVKVNRHDLSATIKKLKNIYSSFFPGNLFDYYFLDEKFNQQYANDKLFEKVFALFAGFAIFIACLGLLGLSLFATLQRTKEIAIRKVFGASVSSIIILLSKNFIKLVVVAFVIASPVAWIIMDFWLRHYAYRININWWIFFAAGLLALIIAFATIGFQSIKAAKTNPVNGLRTE